MLLFFSFLLLFLLLRYMRARGANTHRQVAMGRRGVDVKHDDDDDNYDDDENEPIRKTHSAEKVPATPSLGPL